MGRKLSVYLLRHAKAGSRQRWDGPDDLRPLNAAGRAQARAIVAQHGGLGITRIVSSPYVRCRQTVEPLAQQLRLPVDLSDALAEGAPLAEALRLLEKVVDQTALVCSHGDVIGDLLRHVQRLGVPLDEDRLEKGSTWALHVDEGAVVEARYLPPPA